MFGKLLSALANPDIPDLAVENLRRHTHQRVARQLEALKKLRVKLGEVKKEFMYPASKVDYEALDHMLEVDIYELGNLGLLARRPQQYLEPLFLVYQMMSKDYEDYNTRSGNAIARLKELRTALISAAVTGKIDVREEAA